MKDTNICYPLQNLGYKGNVVITDFYRYHSDHLNYIHE